MKSSKTNIIKLVDYNDKGKSWSVEDMLRDCLEEKDLAPYPKALVLFLNDSDENYSTSFAQAGMSRIDIVTLLHAAALMFTRKLVGKKEI